MSIVLCSFLIKLFACWLFSFSSTLYKLENSTLLNIWPEDVFIWLIIWLFNFLKLFLNATNFSFWWSPVQKMFSSVSESFAVMHNDVSLVYFLKLKKSCILEIKFSLLQCIIPLVMKLVSIPWIYLYISAGCPLSSMF